VHAEFWQVDPLGQTWPQDPQLLLSAVGSRQTSLHKRSAPGHEPPQVEPLHVALPFVGTWHGAHDVPHDPVDVLLEQVLPHT
jgi:hypothetical protein